MIFIFVAVVVLLVVAGSRRRARERDAIGLAWVVQQVPDQPADISTAVHRIPTAWRRK